MKALGGSRLVAVTWTSALGLVLLGLAACGSGGGSCAGAACGRDGAADADAASESRDVGPSSADTPDASCGSRDGFLCVIGGGQACGDVVIPAVCEAGQWTCPPGSSSASGCQCFGVLGPGCVCTSNGVVCTVDGGFDEGKDAPAVDASAVDGDAAAGADADADATPDASDAGGG
jgi:hypothetical protein